MDYPKIVHQRSPRYNMNPMPRCVQNLAGIRKFAVDLQEKVKKAIQDESLSASIQLFKNDLQRAKKASDECRTAAYDKRTDTCDQNIVNLVNGFLDGVNPINEATEQLLKTATKSDAASKAVFQKDEGKEKEPDFKSS